MNGRRMKLLLVISLLFFGMAGGVSVVAAATNSWYPGAGHEPGFLSPDWKLPTYIPMSEPDFLSPDWKVHTITPIADPNIMNSNWKVPSYTPIADPNIMNSNWTVRNYTPIADPNIMNSNWSVQKPVLLRYSLIDPSRLSSYNLDPFASNKELIAQGWHITNRIW